MWRFSFLAFLTILFSCDSYAKSTENNSTPLVVMTFNVRVPIDPTPLDWNTRRHLVMKYIQSKNPDFLGVQEAVPGVVNDLTHELSGYAVLGRGRDKGGEGEGTQIFYKSDRWRIDADDEGTLQFSPTPEIVGSNGWNMQFARIFTWARFINKKTGEAVYVFNTHYPLVPEERLKSSHLLAEKIADRKRYRDPVILMGDFNACESEESIRYLVGAHGSPIQLVDSHRALHPDDNAGTFQAFGKKTDSCKIDFIFTSANVISTSSEIVKDDSRVGYASDHYAVAATVRLMQKR